MTTPSNTTELRWFLGMVNQLGKFLPNLVEISRPLLELLGKHPCWTWGPTQVALFQHIKEELAKPSILVLYNTTAQTKISAAADASAYRLGAVLLPQHGEDWNPVAFASWSMTDTERHYSQIKKEAPALFWACEKFQDYILGKHIDLETDHKALVPLMSTASLDCLPPQVL